MECDGAVRSCSRALAAAVLAAGLAGGAAQAQSIPVPTTSGPVQGSAADANGVVSFKGIPFAAPPVGPLRWRAPQPAPVRSDVLNAVGFGAPCIAPFQPAPSPVAAHAADIPFVWGTMAVTQQYFNPAATAPGAADQAFSSIVQAYWTNFAKTGSPNGPGLPAWQAFRGVGGQVLDLGAAPFACANTDEGRFLFLATYRSHGRMPAAWRTLGAPGNSYPGVGCGTPPFKP